MSRDVPQTSLPWPASSLAVARPIPELAPVMKMRFMAERVESSSLGRRATMIQPHHTVNGQEGAGSDELPRDSVD